MQQEETCMKRKMLLLLCALMACFSFAHAQGSPPGGQTPSLETAILSDPELSAYELVSYAPIEGSGFAFASLKSGLQNTLAAYEMKQGQWVRAFVNINALPRGEMRFYVEDLSFTERFSIRGELTDSSLGHQRGHAVSFYWSNGEYHENYFVFERNEHQDWMLAFYANAGQGGMIDIECNKDGRTAVFYFLEESRQNTRFSFNFRGKMQDFNFAFLPRTPRQARQPNMLPPALPVGWLTAREVPLEGEELIPVYSAPDRKALRGANGKAALSPRGWVQVFGVEGDFALVQYAMLPGEYRIGYIEQKHLPPWYVSDWAAENPLNFTRVESTLFAAQPTDDPLGTMRALVKTTKDSPVTLLSRFGDFVYFEGRQNGRVYRAFANQRLFSDQPAPPEGLRETSAFAYGKWEDALASKVQLAGLPFAIWLDQTAFDLYTADEHTVVYAQKNQLESTPYLAVEKAAPSLTEIRQQLEQEGWTVQACENDIHFFNFSQDNDSLNFLCAGKEGQILRILLITLKGVPLKITLGCPEQAYETWGLYLSQIIAGIEAL